MKRLFLLRHGKSAWGSIGLPDIERPLKKRGMQASIAMGHYFKAQGYSVDEVLCSPARRTTETFSLFSEPAGITLTPRYDRRLYETGAGQLLERLQEVEEPKSAVLLVGHNPGMEDLASRLPSPGTNDPATREMAFKYPTGALTVIDFACATWPDVGWGSGTLVEFRTPRSLDEKYDD
ncbi:MAG: histidine phosphatase family protein [Pseudomonadota bacterium]